MLLGYGYMRNKLVRWGGYLTHRYEADVISLYFYFVFIYDQGGDALTEISPFETKWDEQKSI